MIMDKEQQIAEMKMFAEMNIEYDILDGNEEYATEVTIDYKGFAEALYNAGYRKVPDGAVILSPEERDEEMKAYNEDRKERENELLAIQMACFSAQVEGERLQKENEALQEQLNSANAGNVNCSGCKVVEANAVKEFAERVKLETTVDNRLCVREYDIGYNDGYSEAYYSFHKIIDGLLKEYEK
jgi:hypothetical protein